MFLARNTVREAVQAAMTLAGRYSATLSKASGLSKELWGAMTATIKKHADVTEINLIVRVDLADGKVRARVLELT